MYLHLVLYVVGCGWLVTDLTCIHNLHANLVICIKRYLLGLENIFTSIENVLAFLLFPPTTFHSIYRSHNVAVCYFYACPCFFHCWTVYFDSVEMCVMQVTNRHVTRKLICMVDFVCKMVIHPNQFSLYLLWTAALRLTRRAWRYCLMQTMYIFYKVW